MEWIWYNLIQFCMYPLKTYYKSYVTRNITSWVHHKSHVATTTPLMQYIPGIFSNGEMYMIICLYFLSFKFSIRIFTLK